MTETAFHTLDHIAALTRARFPEDARETLRAEPLDIKEQYERQLKEYQEAYDEAMIEWQARKKLQSLLGTDDEK